jgi:ABC-2 type transport system permease protein
MTTPRRASGSSVTGVLVAKDINLYFKDRFYAFVTILALVAFIAVYFLLPRTVDDTVSFGVYAPVMPPALAAILAEEGVTLESQPSEDALRAAVAAGEFEAGIVLPPDMTEQLAAGARPQVRLYLAGELPAEFRESYQMLVRELAFTIGGSPLDIETEEEVLGPDMAGRQIAPRQRMLPLLAVFILLIETLGLASLISSEIEAGTLRALLVTPVRVSDLFLSKGIVGVGLAFGQAVLLMAITGGLSRQPVIILLALLLGAVMVTGLAFLLASVARDFMSVIGYGMLLLILLVVPGLAVALPGLASGWIRVLPSYYLVDAVHRVVNFEAGWGDVGLHLVALVVSAVLFVALGIAALQRRFA